MRQEFATTLPGFPITIYSEQPLRRALSCSGVMSASFQFQRATNAALTTWETLAEHSAPVDVTAAFPAGTYRWNCTSNTGDMVVGTLEG